MEKTRFTCGMEYLREIDGNGGETAFLCGFKGPLSLFSTATTNKKAGSYSGFSRFKPAVSNSPSGFNKRKAQFKPARNSSATFSANTDYNGNSRLGAYKPLLARILSNFFSDNISCVTHSSL